MKKYYKELIIWKKHFTVMFFYRKIQNKNMHTLILSKAILSDIIN